MSTLLQCPQCNQCSKGMGHHVYRVIGTDGLYDSQEVFDLILQAVVSTVAARTATTPVILHHPPRRNE